jgi:Flp pilus assembly protein TadG
MVNPVQRVATRLAQWGGARSGNVALVVALTLPVLVLLAGGAVDVSAAVGAKAKLQDALDAAALAVSVEVAKNPNEAETSLKAIAQNVLAANYVGGSPILTGLHVCAPVQKDCTATDGSTLASNTVGGSATVNQPCSFLAIVPGACSGPNQSLPVSASSTTTIGFGRALQLNIVMDSSASMIVGSTAADVTKITNWVSANWNSVKPGDPYPYGNGGSDNPPCAFACHDVGGSTTPADIATGLTNAHTAGATTRFDVMIGAAGQLISHIQSEVQSNPILAGNTYMFNVMSFDTSLHSWGTANTTSYSAAQSAVSSVTPGLDTHMATVLSQLVTSVGTSGNGASTATPLKFLILVTDGLQSDRDSNWGCKSWGTDTAWGFPTKANKSQTVCFNGYATTISSSTCTQFKNNGVVLAVLETPYVPLTGQSPNIAPYERTVRHVIYPNGPNTASAVSAALQACASPGYYYQATDDSQIGTGFATLTDKFIANSAYIAK